MMCAVVLVLHPPPKPVLSRPQVAQRDHLFLFLED